MTKQKERVFGASWPVAFSLFVTENIFFPFRLSEQKLSKLFEGQMSVKAASCRVCILVYMDEFYSKYPNYRIYKGMCLSWEILQAC